MDEELIDTTADDVVESGINTEDFEQKIETEETVNTVEVETVEEIEIEVSESVGWVGGDSTRHYSLYGRDEPDQHPIEAIIGLRSELNEIEALKTVYSDKIGIANYYEWSDGSHDEFGYFVSLVPHSSTIKICDGADIFGVTVESVGFAGGQGADAPRDNTYGLVATSGLVDVRCESDVAEGDCVISNAYGIAEKTISGCGYKVIAIENKNGIDYAAISLGVQACTTDLMGKNIQRLDDRIDNAEINITAAMNVANEAYNKALENNVVSEEAVRDALDAMNKANDALDAANKISGVVSSANTTAAQAKSIAESAITTSESIRQEAVKSANGALSNVNDLVNKFEPLDEWVDPVTGQVSSEYIVNYMDSQGLATKAEVRTVEGLTEDNKSAIEQNAQSITMMVASVDKYSVGKYSQAHGLTLEQARNILKEGMIYIPSKHGDISTHVESYSDDVSYSFTHTFYYVWTMLEDGAMWSEGVGEVWFGTERPAGDAYTYWYDGANLFMLQDGLWIEVATLAGNVNNRMTSMIRQDVDEVTTEIVNAYGSVAGFGAKLSDTDAKVNSIASWPTGGGTHNMAVLEQKSDENGSYMVLATVTDVDGEPTVTELSGATIVLNDSERGSFIQIEADNIDLSGYVSFNDLSNSNPTKTIINGDNITTGAIQSANYVQNASGSRLSLEDGTFDSKYFKVSDTGEITATKGKIGGWKILETELYSGDAGINAGSTYTKQSLVTSDESPIRFYCGDSSLVDSKFIVLEDGSLYASAVDLTGVITATGGEIGGWKIADSALTRAATTDSTGNPTWELADKIRLTHQLGTMYDTYVEFGWSIGSEFADGKVYPYYGLATDSNLAFKVGTGRKGRLIGDWTCEGTWIESNSGSDMRIKNSIDDYTQEYDVLFDNIKPRRYKYNNGTSDRYHTGYIAQEVVEAIESAGLTTQDFAGVMLTNPNTEDECWYLRRDEFVALNTWQIQKLKTRVSELEHRIATLEALINKE